MSADGAVSRVQVLPILSTALGNLVPKKHQDTSISRPPLCFKEAIEVLANSSRQTVSQVRKLGSTTELAPASETSKKQTARRRKSSAG